MRLDLGGGDSEVVVDANGADLASGWSSSGCQAWLCDISVMSSPQPAVQRDYSAGMTDADAEISRREIRADQREIDAEVREGQADERERLADDRDRVADERERRADERDWVADQREQVADQRDAQANLRERRADEETLRERLADQREIDAEIREGQVDEREQLADEARRSLRNIVDLAASTPVSTMSRYTTVKHHPRRDSGRALDAVTNFHTDSRASLRSAASGCA